MLFRHGDLLIETIDTLPHHGPRRNSPILAYGAVTGHVHRIEDSARAEIFYSGNEIYLHILAPTRIIHEEHHPIDLDPGYYRVWCQREYMPVNERWRTGVSFRTVRD